ncbi:hypothetical protein MD484_g7111, partial [Candolleomyces efflorescens]
MHQEHNIPWTLLSKHIKFVREHKGYTPCETGFFVKNPVASPSSTTATKAGIRSQGSTANDLNHFMRVLISTIRTFSETERAKYPSRETILSQKFPVDGNVIYSDELKVLYPEFLNDERQKVECWIERAYKEEGEVGKGMYSTCHGDLADVVKILFLPSSFHTFTTTSSTSSSHPPTPPVTTPTSSTAPIDSAPPTKSKKPKSRSPAEPNLETLLVLAHHPSIPLGTLHYLSWGHHFGWSRVMESALGAYILLNLIFALSSDSKKAHHDLIVNGGYREIRAYKGTIRGECWSMDYPAQQIPHQRFWKECRNIEEAARSATDSSSSSSSSDSTTLPSNSSSCPLGKPKCVLGEDVIPLMHLDMHHLDEYLKLNFGLLYKYDMVLRECGVEPEWEREVTRLMGFWVKGLKVEHGEWVEEEGRWAAPYFA